MSKSIVLYANKKINFETLQALKSFYLSQHPNYDFAICHQHIIDDNIIMDTACINAYHLYWLDGIVIFTSYEDYIDNKDKIIAQAVLCLNEKDINNINISNIECEILVKTNNKILKMEK